MNISEKDGHFMEKVHTPNVLPDLNILISALHVGLWYYLSGEALPSLTFVGSSNFG